jgi:DNA-binding transcriptional LysR family regulator
LAHALASFRVRYPGIQLVIDESGSRDLVRQLAEGAIDLAMITSPVHRGDPTLDTVPILREQLVVAVPRSMDLEFDSFRIEDLRDRPLVMFREGYDLRSMTLTACQRAGFQPQFAIEGGEMDAVLSFVEAGLGIAVVPSMVLLDRPKLRGVTFMPPTPIRTISLAHRTDVHPTRAAEEFRFTLLHLLSDAHTQGDLPAGVEFIAPGEPSSDQSGHGSTSAGQSLRPSSWRTTRRASPSE